MQPRDDGWQSRSDVKLYRDFPDASVSMRDSVELRRILEQVIRVEHIRPVVESGTYLGLGSTHFVADSFPGDSKPTSFVTLEASWWDWRRAPYLLPAAIVCLPGR